MTDAELLAAVIKTMGLSTETARATWRAQRVQKQRVQDMMSLISSELARAWDAGYLAGCGDSADPDAGQTPNPHKFTSGR